jgi:hypothetical protein
MLNKVVRNITHILGWKTKRKIVVFESDDWGSIRMPTNQIRDRLINFDKNINRFISFFLTPISLIFLLKLKYINKSYWRK